MSAPNARSSFAVELEGTPEGSVPASVIVLLQCVSLNIGVYRSFPCGQTWKHHFREGRKWPFVTAEGVPEAIPRGRTRLSA